MIDYFYTSIYQQTLDGTPSLNPLFYIYPNDTSTFGIDHQFFFGPSVLVSPVTEENSTSVDIYLPDDIFYDWNAGYTPVRGNGETLTLDNVDFQTIPIHIRGGSIIPLRTQSANTTTELRKQQFELVVAPGLNNSAMGRLYLDDGISLEQNGTTYVEFVWDGSSITMGGTYDYDAGVNMTGVYMLGQTSAPQAVTFQGQPVQTTWNSSTQVAYLDVDFPLTGNATIRYGQIGSYTGEGATLSRVDTWLSAWVAAVVAWLVW